MRYFGILIRALSLFATIVPGSADAEGPGKAEINVIPHESCDPLHNLRDYPFNLDRISKADRFARAAAFRSNDKVRVVVLDNGFVGYSQAKDTQVRAGSKNFPEIFFYNRPPDDYEPFMPVTPISTSSNQFVKGHGTHVVGIILGGMIGSTEPRTSPEGVYPEIRRLLLNDPNWKYDPAAKTAPKSWLELFVYGLSPDGETLEATNLERFALDIRQLPRDFRPPEIMNVSLLYTPPNNKIHPVLLSFPDDFPGTLVIASAGNLATELTAGGSGQYPAMASSDMDNLLVVGSHDSDYKRSAFSDFHPTRVSISAPGCAIKSWTSADGGAVTASGTSQAAAFVTFAAALLRTHWGPVPPLLLRERLLVSARYSQDLAKGCPVAGATEGACSLFGNVLDIEMTLYYSHDVIEYCKNITESGPECETVITAGTLASIPKSMATCIGNVAQMPADDKYATGMSWPGAIRRTDFRHFEAIVRDKNQPRRLVQACVGEVPVGNFDLIPQDGRLQDMVSIPATAVVRVVTHSSLLN